MEAVESLSLAVQMWCSVTWLSSGHGSIGLTTQSQRFSPTFIILGLKDVYMVWRDIFPFRSCLPVSAVLITIITTHHYHAHVHKHIADLDPVRPPYNIFFTMS